jgi:uncharacterized membrane protein HdeD (DUF308 family)
MYCWVLFYGVFGAYAGYVLITKKERWAWMFVVLAQVNLINWAINYYYGSRRWNDFRKSEALPNSEGRVTQPPSHNPG